jgi:DNA-binding IscR family transcriptional regulator
MIPAPSASKALRAMARLALPDEAPAVPEGVPTAPGDLADVLATLEQAGLLARPAAGAGYLLARDAEEILLAEIVEPFSGGRAAPGCLLAPEEPCRDGCAPGWVDVQAAVLAFLESTTLADLVAAHGGRGRTPGRAARKGARPVEVSP